MTLSLLAGRTLLIENAKNHNIKMHAQLCIGNKALIVYEFIMREFGIETSVSKVTV